MKPESSSLSKKMKLSDLESHLNYQFKNKALLIQALTHSSYYQQKNKLKKDNQRLEFLGDRVLGLLTAEYLFHQDKLAREGQLAVQLNAFVCKESCAKIAKKMNLDQFILLSSSEEAQGGRDKDTILADSCEAILAAIYLDGGLFAVKRIYDQFWISMFNQTRLIQKDPKSRLQDWVLKKNNQIPVYELINKIGADHMPHFTVKVSIFNGMQMEGQGKTKREAEYEAAKKLLYKLT